MLLAISCLTSIGAQGGDARRRGGVTSGSVIRPPISL